MLKIAGYINILIGMAHLVGLFWAEQMFAYTGQTQNMLKLAEKQSWLPTALTIFVSIIFIIFGLYGLVAGGGVKNLRLPYLKLIVFDIAALYIIRGVGGYLFYLFAPGTLSTHEVLFSTIALAIGALFLVGGLRKWGYIGCGSSN